jgi:hypothetical protein
MKLTQILSNMETEDKKLTDTSIPDPRPPMPKPDQDSGI